MPQVKDRKKFEMSQPEVMAAYYASLKSIFERFDWPTSPKGAAVAPSKSLCMWDEIAFMSRDGTVERVVKCGGSKPTVPSGGVGTDQSFHFTIFAGVNASGIALPPFCVFDQKTWSTGFDDGMGTGGTRLAGVPMEWSFANTKSGSMTKSKGYGDTFEPGTMVGFAQHCKTHVRKFLGLGTDDTSVAAFPLLHLVDQCGPHDCDVAGKLLADDNQWLVGLPKVLHRCLLPFFLHSHHRSPPITTTTYLVALFAYRCNACCCMLMRNGVALCMASGVMVVGQNTSHYIQVGDAKELNANMQEGRRTLTTNLTNCGVFITRNNVALLASQTYNHAYSTPNIYAAVERVGHQYCSDANGQNARSHIIIDDKSVNAAIEKNKATFALGESFRKGGVGGTKGIHFLRNREQMALDAVKDGLAKKNPELARMVPNWLNSGLVQTIQSLRYTGHTVPCRTMPSRAVPCRAVRYRAVPCRAVLTTVHPTIHLTVHRFIHDSSNHSSSALLSHWVLVPFCFIHDRACT